MTRLIRSPGLGRALFPLLAFVLVGCDGGDGEGDITGTTDEEPVVDCGAEVTSVDVTVDFGADIVFDWSPRCRMALLLIEPVGSGHDMWSVGDGESNLVEPPITFGEAPAGVPSSEVERLTLGESYEVILWHIAGTTERLLAVETFGGE